MNKSVSKTMQSSLLHARGRLPWGRRKGDGARQGDIRKFVGRKDSTSSMVSRAMLQGRGNLETGRKMKCDWEGTLDAAKKNVKRKSVTEGFAKSFVRTKASSESSVSAMATEIDSTSNKTENSMFHQHPTNVFPDLELAMVSPSETVFDVVIAGAGPSGLSVAERVASAGFSVSVIDPAPLGPWVNNYGVWVDEFEAMGLDDCFETVWNYAVVHLDSKERGKRTLDRPYARVDRPKLKRKILERCIKAGVKFHQAKVEDVSHADGKSKIICSDNIDLEASFVVDATGHSRKLIKFDKEYNPGYQGAYGITVEVENHPFDVDAMLFMDWRDDHLQDDEELRKGNEA